MIWHNWKLNSILLLLFGVLLLLGNSSGRASRNQTNTGAPGDDPKVCQSCHNSSDIQVKVGLTVEDNNGFEIKKYIPGVTYNVKLSIDPAIGNPSGYGMQMVSISDSLFRNAGTWKNINPPLNTIFNNRTQRNYVEHFIVGDQNVFEVEWQAPYPHVGPISFYAAGAGVNRNQSSSGDGAGADKLTILPSQSNVVNTIFPNPTTGIINFPDLYSFENLYDYLGRAVNIVPENNTIDLRHLSAGIYWIQVRQSANDEMELYKILKI